MEQLINRMAVYLVIAMITGCNAVKPQATQKRVEQEPVTIPEPSPATQPVESLSASEYITRAIKSLQVGEPTQAKQDLEHSLELRPHGRRAKQLLQQIAADPQQLFGAEHFDYVVQPGDSISKISQKFLGDALAFYALARYNNIANPSQVKAGQTIKIPGQRPTEVETSPPPKPTPNTASSTTDDQQTPYTKALAKFNEQDFTGVINLLEETVDSASAVPLLDLLIKSYQGQADKLIADGRPGEANWLLDKAIQLDPSNQSIQDRQREIDDKLEADRLFAEGIDQYTAGQREKALETFGLVLIYDPANQEAFKQQEQIKKELAEEYHTEAMILFRRHQLDEAIVLWDRVLAINPEHEFAGVYRARAEDMKTRISEIDDANP